MRNFPKRTKNILIEIADIFNSMKKWKKIFLIFFFLFLFVMFFSLTYYDMGITTYNGISFWDCLFSGKIRKFYSVNNNSFMIFSQHLPKTQGNYTAYYDFLIYAIFAVWNFPLWLVKVLGGIEFPLVSFFATCWAKSISLFFLILSSVVFFKIANILNINRRFCLKCTFLYITSIYSIFYIFALGQYDSIVIFFMLSGVYFAINDKKWLCLLMFAIAIPAKMFALFALIIVLLYIEKNIFKVIGFTLLALLPTALCRIVFPFSNGNNVSLMFTNTFFTNTFQFGSGVISLFVVLFIMICIHVYLFQNIKQSFYFLIFDLFLCYVLFGCLCICFPYWLFYFVPFMYLIFCYNKSIFNINLALDTFAGFSIFLNQALGGFKHIYSSALPSNMLFSRIFPQYRTHAFSLKSLLIRIFGKNNEILQLLPTIFYSMFFACIIFIIFVNLKNSKKEIILINKIEINLNLFWKIFRLLFTIIILVLPIILYYM